ncbi:SDR family oxidoreductase [Candidatus Beckwithbacteria bacterium]|nr:SDR family oxidoreductase [Candidatus Beckwithbacteria bacterium]
MKKTILITGGTGKIGQVLTKHFLKKDYKVIITSRNEQQALKLFANSKNIPNLSVIEIDLRADKAINHVISSLEKLNAKPYALIHCARNLESLKYSPDLETRIKNWQAEYLLDVVIPYELSLAVAKMKESKLTNVVTISSMYGVVAANPHLYTNPQIQSPVQYSVAKAALIHATKEMAIRLSPQKIKVNCISYGGIEGRADEDFKKRYGKLCPIGRMLTEEEIIKPVEFLISNSSTAMQGHNLIVDGGWSIW